jgi:hypothetical protein
MELLHACYAENHVRGVREGAEGERGMTFTNAEIDAFLARELKRGRTDGTR